jgi:hypothetical protein
MIKMAEWAPRLLEPDALRPSQFFATRRRQARRKTGEYQLLVAVLQNAVDCFQKYVWARSKAERRLFKEAEQWIMGENEGHAADAARLAFSFPYVCEVLDIEPDYLRDGLRRWRDAQLATGPMSRDGGR